MSLCKKASLKLDMVEEDVLARLSRFAKWKSRYPVPVEMTDLMNMLRYSDGRAYFVDYYKPDDLQVIDTVVKRLRDLLRPSPQESLHDR